MTLRGNSKKRAVGERPQRASSRTERVARAADPADVDDDEDRRFLAAYDLTRYPRPSVAVDVVALTVEGGRLHAALYERTEPPQRERFALPGGFLRMDESLHDAAVRLLRDKVGLERVFLEQLQTFGDVHRDPRGRVIAVAYVALVDSARFRGRMMPNAQVARLDVPWPSETGGPVSALDAAGSPLSLAFDHADILGVAVKRLRNRLDDAPVGFQLLPHEFTLRQLQEVHEAVRGESVNKDSFRRRMLASGLLVATGSREQAVIHRPAELYRFVRTSAV